MQKIPATVITGFLGAGKTTLIQNMLLNANGRRLALIINEFGDLGVDGGVLKGCGIEACAEDDMIELNNGCICCTVADDFLPAMEKLIDRDNPPDHIIIETSGLALPQPLVNAFNWPDIKTRVTVDGVVVVVDSAAVADGRFAHDHDALEAQRAADETLDHDSPIEELFEDQLAAADLIILSKTDLIDGDTLVRVKEDLNGRMSRTVGMVGAVKGSVPNAVLLGLGAETETKIGDRPASHDHHHHHDHDDHDDDDHDHDDHHHDHGHDEFESFVAEFGPVQNLDLFLDQLAGVITDHGILRLKGFGAVSGKAMRLVVQAVGTRVDTYFDRPFAADEPWASRMVVIGEAGLDHDAIIKALQQAAA